MRGFRSRLFPTGTTGTDRSLGLATPHDRVHQRDLGRRRRKATVYSPSMVRATAAGS